jgi:WD40 repeat protein
MRTLTLGRRNVHGVAYSPDGRFLVSLNSQIHIRFWDLSTFKKRLAFALTPCTDFWRGYGSFGGTFSPCGNLLPLRKTVWDMSRAWQLVRQPRRGADAAPTGGATDQPFRKIDLERPHIANVLGVAASGQTLAGATYPESAAVAGLVYVWDRQGRYLRHFRAPGHVQHRGGLAMAGDGRTLAMPLLTRAIVLFDLVTGQEVRRLQHTDRVSSMVFSADNRYLLSTAGRSVWLWDLTTGKRMKRFKAFDRNAGAPAFHPGGELVGAAGRDGKVRLWRLANCKEVACLDWQIGAVHGLAFSPDGATAAAAGHNGKIVLWDLD